MTDNAQPAPLFSAEVRGAAETLAGAALARVQEPATGRVRVEDYLTVLGSITGESALVAAGVVDVESSEIPPGVARVWRPDQRRADRRHDRPDQGAE